MKLFFGTDFLRMIYSVCSTDESIAHIAAFIAGLWQIHPFVAHNALADAEACAAIALKLL